MANSDNRPPPFGAANNSSWSPAKLYIHGKAGFPGPPRPPQNAFIPPSAGGLKAGPAPFVQGVPYDQGKALHPIASATPAYNMPAAVPAETRVGIDETTMGISDYAVPVSAKPPVKSLETKVEETRAAANAFKPGLATPMKAVETTQMIAKPGGFPIPSVALPIKPGGPSPFVSPALPGKPGGQPILLVKQEIKPAAPMENLAVKASEAGQFKNPPADFTGAAAKPPSDPTDFMGSYGVPETFPSPKNEPKRDIVSPPVPANLPKQSETEMPTKNAEQVSEIANPTVAKPGYGVPGPFGLFNKQGSKFGPSQEAKAGTAQDADTGQPKPSAFPKPSTSSNGFNPPHPQTGYRPAPVATASNTANRPTKLELPRFNQEAKQPGEQAKEPIPTGPQTEASAQQFPPPADPFPSKFGPNPSSAVVKTPYPAPKEPIQPDAIRQGNPPVAAPAAVQPLEEAKNEVVGGKKNVPPFPMPGYMPAIWKNASSSQPVSAHNSAILSDTDGQKQEPDEFPKTEVEEIGGGLPPINLQAFHPFGNLKPGVLQLKNPGSEAMKQVEGPKPSVPGQNAPVMTQFQQAVPQKPGQAPFNAGFPVQKPYNPNQGDTKPPAVVFQGPPFPQKPNFPGNPGELKPSVGTSQEEFGEKPKYGFNPPVEDPLRPPAFGQKPFSPPVFTNKVGPAGPPVSAFTAQKPPFPNPQDTKPSVDPSPSRSSQLQPNPPVGDTQRSPAFSQKPSPTYQEVPAKASSPFTNKLGPAGPPVSAFTAQKPPFPNPQDTKPSVDPSPSRSSQLQPNPPVGDTQRSPAFSQKPSPTYQEVPAKASSPFTNKLGPAGPPVSATKAGPPPFHTSASPSPPWNPKGAANPSQLKPSIEGPQQALGEKPKSGLNPPVNDGQIPHAFIQKPQAPEPKPEVPAKPLPILPKKPGIVVPDTASKPGLPFPSTKPFFPGNPSSQMLSPGNPSYTAQTQALKADPPSKMGPSAQAVNLTPFPQKNPNPSVPLFPAKADNAPPWGKQGAKAGPGDFPIQGQAIEAIAKPGERPPFLNPILPNQKPGISKFPMPTLSLSDINECQQCHKQRNKDFIYTDVTCGAGCIVCKYCYANGIDQRKMECPRCHRAWSSDEKDIIGIYKLTLP